MAETIGSRSDKFWKTSTGEATVQAGAKTASRMVFIDYLRVLLTVLVILHHLAITYGADGSWAYQEPTTETAGILLTLFTALNQGFFMGLFFLLAGYFVPGAVDRKGGWRFAKDRLVRLGIPLMAYSYLISPLVLYFKGANEGWWTGSLGGFYLHYWQEGWFVPGPLWFVETLLIFSLVYAAGRAVTSRLGGGAQAKSEPKRKPLGHWQMIVFVAAMASISFAVRLVSPIGVEWENLQLAFFPQYILMFAAGIMAYRNGWLPELGLGLRRVWGSMAGLSVIALLAAFVLATSSGSTDAFAGGMTVEALILATWEAVYCPAMAILLLGWFYARFNRPGRLGQGLAENAYAAYVIHAPVIVLLAVSLSGLHIDPLAKFALAGLLGVGLCFAMSEWVVRRIPGAERVL